VKASGLFPAEFDAQVVEVCVKAAYKYFGLLIVDWFLEAGVSPAF
jgi:hypothetical protein